MVKGSSITSFAYGQGKVVFVDDHTLATSTGNGVVFFSIKASQQVGRRASFANTSVPRPKFSTHIILLLLHYVFAAGESASRHQNGVHIFQLLANTSRNKRSCACSNLATR